MTLNGSNGSPSSKLCALAIAIAALTVALWLFVTVLSRIWPWLAAAGGVALLVAATIFVLRWWRDRHW